MPTAKPSPPTTADPRHGAFRLATGGQIDRSRVINFSWDGRPLTACAGDTLAAALLAHGESLVGRGFKFHRPRGILSAGASVILVEQDDEFGGRLLLETCTIGGVPALQWLRDTLAELQANPRVRLLPATTAFGLYDHGHAGLLERAVDRDPTSRVRHRYWRVRARALLLATGAIEQP